jgi:ribosomal protein S18 acetylase RimI-like enzyme
LPFSGQATETDGLQPLGTTQLKFSINQERPSMPMRLLQLPEDFVPMAEMTMEAWQYPENPEWGLQRDEEEALSESMRNIQRIWPIIRLAQWLSPDLRDLLRGYVWEEDGRIVGFTNTNRQGGTDTWYISAVGVLPDYRRRGIAQKLVEATITLIREHGGVKALLDMTDGNTPAHKLYEKLGFEQDSSSGRYTITPEKPPWSPQCRKDIS